MHRRRQMLDLLGRGCGVMSESIEGEFVLGSSKQQCLSDVRNAD